MAHGSPDYWSHESLGLPAPGIHQTLWAWEEVVAVGAGATADGGGHTTMPGERLYLTAIQLTVRQPGTNLARVLIGGVVYTWIYFDTILFLPLSPSALINLNAGAILNIRFTNYDIVAQTFYCYFWGFRVTLVPGTPPAPALEAGLGLAVANAGV